MTGYLALKENKLEEGKLLFSEDGYIIYSNIEDSLRFEIPKEKKTIVVVSTLGDTYNFDSEEYGYYGMSNCKYIQINRVLSEQEVLDLILKKDELKVKRFVEGYRIPIIYLERFLEKGSLVSNAIKYYQNGNKNVYKEHIKKLVKEYGQDNNKGSKRE